MKTLIVFALLASQAPADVAVDLPDAGAVAVEEHAAPAGDVALPVPGIDNKDGKILSDSVKDVADIATNWKALGALGIAAAVLAMLMRLTKLGILARLLEDRQLGWLRPVITMVLGGIGGGVGAVQAGQPLLPGIVAGVFAAFSATGMHELGRLAWKHERAAVRVDKNDLQEAKVALEEKVKKAASEANAESAGIADELMKARQLPPKKRLKKLAELSKKAKA